MEFQLIAKALGCPYEIKITDRIQKENHFHNTFELLLLLNGSITYLSNGRSHHLGSRDFIFANPYEIHSCSQATPDCRLMLIQIETAPFKNLLSPGKQLFFKWEDTYNNREPDFYQDMIRHMRSIIIESTNQEPAYLAKVFQNVLGILILLEEHCGVFSTPQKQQPAAVRQTKKSAEIMDFLNAHYMEQLSLNELSEALHISAPYISKLFKETFQVGILEYLNRLRIQKSLPALSQTNDYILDIAVSVGFNNAKTYGRIFQQEMGITPTEYRKKHMEAAQPVLPDLAMPAADGPAPDLLHFLSGTEADRSGLLSGRDLAAFPLTLDFTHGPCKKRPKCWNQILSIGAAALLLQRRVQQEILDAVRDMHFTYVRFTGVLSDTLQIYQEDSNGTPYYFWILLDEILDFLQSHQLKPFICLGFMPDKLAARKVPSPYRWNANTSKPKSMKLWTDYLAAFLQHCISRYTYEEVCTWKFEFWNSPELQGLFWHDTTKDFYDFFLASYQTFRRILPLGKFGSPGLVKFNRYKSSKDFLRFCVKHHVQFDFICLHIFMLTDPQNPTKYYQHELIHKLKPDTDMLGAGFFIHAVSQLNDILDELGIHAPVYITEWNVSPYFHDLSRDTCFMSAYIAHTINTLPSAVKRISFWALTDYLDEHIPYQDMFTGELGLKTHNGLPKPSYLAFILLNRMHERLFASGDGYFVTVSNNGYQILLYNYSFYSREFLNGSARKLTTHDRYQIFEKKDAVRFQLHLTLPPGNYRIEHHTLNRQYGSVYDSWLRMGAPEHIDQATYHYLHNKAYPEISINHKKIESQLLLEEIVPVHGLLLITLTKNDTAVQPLQ